MQGYAHSFMVLTAKSPGNLNNPKEVYTMHLSPYLAAYNLTSIFLFVRSSNFFSLLKHIAIVLQALYIMPINLLSFQVD